MKLLVNVALLVIMCVAWAAGFVFVKLMEGAFPPILIAAGRSLLAAGGILGYCLATRQPLRPAFRRSPSMLLLGLIGPAALWTCVATGEQDVGPGMASLLVCLVPVSALIFTAVPPISRRVWWPAWPGAAVATFGLVLVIGPEHLLNDDSTVKGIAFIGTGFFVFGLYCVVSEHLTTGLRPAPVAGVSMLYATTVLWVISLAMEAPWEMRAGARDWGYMIALGLACSALPNLVFFVIIKRAGAVFASLYGYLMPVVGLAMTAVVFGNMPSWTIYLGTPIAFAGMALLQWAQARRPRPTL